MRVLRLGAVVFGIALLCVGAVAGVARASTTSWTTVVSGLDNPRDLAWGPNGNLYVAEAGHGASPIGNPGDCIDSGPEGRTCFGLTSGVSVIQGSSFHRVISGFPSLADETGSAATGIDGISFKGNNGYAIETGASDFLAGLTLQSDIIGRLRSRIGRLIQFTPGGSWNTVADVGHRDFRWTLEHKNLVPDQFPDANPYGVLAVEGTRWVVDAAANTIDRVWPNGTIAIAAFIPNPPFSDAVPTCIDRGPDGALYVGQLTGVGNPPGSAAIWRFAPGTAHPLTKWATGLTAITGCGFGPGGQFYATELSTLGLEGAAPGTGEVVRVAPHSTSPVPVATGLSFPGGFASGHDEIYVSNWSVAPAVSGLGAVVKIDTP
jgi:hypothetical protein